MRFGVLGTLLVHDGQAVISVPAARQRAVLATLLVRAGRPVAPGELADIIWDGTPPNGADGTIRSHIMRLRRVLGPRAGPRVLTRAPGYLIDAGDDEVDLLQFGCLCQTGGAAVRAGSPANAWAMLTGALELWRGSPLADVPSRTLHDEVVPQLEQLRLQALEWRADAGLDLGRHAELVSELQALTAGHPLRERFHAQLMLALYRSGRQAEALDAYLHARHVLVDELGAEPGAELRDLHQRVLTADPALAVPPAAPPARPGPGQVMPQQLPAAVGGFTGRAAELGALTGMLGEAAETSRTVVISAIAGTAGVGKTALAVHWAHQVADRFPDGQLYVNLRGYDPGQPMTPADALAGFLRDLGVPGPDIPAELEQRAARYRSVLAGRRMLVLLDNAGSAEQVRPLLPATPGCLALATSRDSLAGLIARDGAVRLDLDLLPLADAVTLLRALIGARVDADAEAATELAAWCGRLPLALRVAAELAAARLGTPLASLAGELASQQRRLDLLEAGGDPHTAVRAVFSWSVRHLDPGAARAFRLLGLHPGPDLDTYAAVALTGGTLDQVGPLLDRLRRAHLIEAAGPGRYAMHDLLRDYARELAAAEDGEDEQRVALTRLFDYYLHAAAASMDTLYPAEQHQRPAIPALAAIAPRLAEPDTARAWLAAELPCLVTAVVHAATHGWREHATKLAATLFRYLDSGGHFSEAVTIHDHARGAAEQAGDVAAEAEALTSLAVAEHRQGRYERMSGHLEQALALSRQAGDRGGEARALGNLGNFTLWQGRFEQAAGHHQLALSLYRETGNRIGEAMALSNLGEAEVRLGRFEQAASHLQQALALSRDTGHQDGEAYVHISLGDVCLRQGDYQQAASYLQRALALSRAGCDRVGETYALTSLGELDLRQGRYQHAARHLQEALALARDAGARDKETEALSLLGEVSLATGDHGQARTHHAAALALASQTGDRYWQARAHDGLARTHHARADLEQARLHWQQALTRYGETGAPEADEVRARLASWGKQARADPKP
jgi:DNA-binding SARP family transcriptional activator/tetratricopeptide (TPR) repeat protein